MQQNQGAGTINDPSDEDEDRTVEIAFPLEGIRRPARRPVPPEAGDVAGKFLPLRVSGNYHRRLTVTGSGRFGQHYSDDLEELGITRRSLSHFVWPPTLQATIAGTRPGVRGEDLDDDGHVNRWVLTEDSRVSPVSARSRRWGSQLLTT